VDETVQFAQDVVGQVTAGLGLAVDIDGDLGVLAANFGDEAAQVLNGRVEIRVASDLLVSIDRMKALARLCCWANCDRSP